MYGRFTVADEIAEQDGYMRVDFSTYDLDYERALMLGGVPEEYYMLTGKEAENKPELELVCHGTAIIKRKLENGEIPYTVNRYFVRTGKVVSDEETVPITISFNRRYEEGVQEFAQIFGFGAYEGASQEAEWVYFTDYYDIADEERIVELGRGGDRYYFIENGTVKCLNVQDGTELWKNEDYGGDAGAVDFSDNAIYLCGRYGPDLFIMDYSGRTLAKLETINPNYYWASAVGALDKTVQITFDGSADGDQHVLEIDPMDGSFIVIR